MAITPIGLLNSGNPVLDTVNDATIEYTLAGGESVAANRTLVLFLGSAGSATAVIQSVADTQGNTYLVDGVEGPGGSVAASIASGSIIVPLAAGDVITVTLGHACTDKALLMWVLSGLASVSFKDLAAIGGLSGAGNNAPQASTGAAATSQADELVVALTVWNGNATNTDDASFHSPPLFKGHFDNVGAAQTKQMSAKYKIVSAAGAQAVVDGLSANQPWAVVLVTYKQAAAGGGGGSAKVVPRGLACRGSFGKSSNLVQPPNGYSAAEVIDFIDLSWRDIQPLDTNALDPTMVATVTGWLDAAAAAGKVVMLRFFAGIWAPQWERDKVGFMMYADPFSSPVTPMPLHKFWTAQSIADYDRVQQLMAAQWDGHAALRAVFLGLAATQYPEQMQRGFSAGQNRAEFVGGNAGWAGTQIDVPGAGYTDALNKAAVKAGIDIHAARWPTTPAAFSVNPYMQITDYATFKSADDKTISNTKELIDYFVASLAGSKRCILANNSVRDSYFNPDGTLVTTTKYGQMYVYMTGKKVPRHYQCATVARVGDFNATMAGVVGPLKGNSCEPPTNSGQSPYDATNMASWNAALLGNAIPLIDPYAPDSTGPPVLVVQSGVGFTPGTVLRATMGTWDGGPDGVAHYVIKWYRTDPVSGDIVGSALRTQTYTNKAATDDYTLVAGDVGYQLIAEVTADNATGTSAPRDSDPTPTIVSAAPPACTVTVLPAASNPNPVAGDVLSFSAGEWAGSPQPTSFQWAINRSPDGVTWETVQIGPSNQYTTSLNDRGYRFSADVIAFNGSSSNPASSPPTQPVNADPVITLSDPAQLTTVLAQVRPTYLIAGSVTPRAGVPITSVKVSGVPVTFDSVTNTFSTTVAINADGVNAFPITATDQAGNTATVIVNFVVPTGAIVISFDLTDIELRVRQRGLG